MLQTPGQADTVRAAHHQIGNSLQSVASFLALESRQAPAAAAGVLNEAGRRVRAVMRLHQRLQENGGDIVRLDDLLGDVCRDVAELDSVDRDARILVDIHPLFARSGTASALAMITAEWLGNALEHGSASRAGTVAVALEPVAAGARLAVSDDGAGSSSGEWKPGFGSALIARLARQLGGTIRREVDAGGSRLELTCPGIWSPSACE